jgi:hypothetical protein
MPIRRLVDRRWSSRLLLGVLVVAPLAILSGCQNDDITTYQAPRSESLAALRFRQRLVAVIIPQGDNMWVFKLLAPEQKVGAVVEDFDHLIGSVELSKDAAKPIDWSLPKDWTQLPGNAQRYATLKTPGDEPAEVSVTRLPNSPFLENINRWRKQIGLSAITEEQAELFTRRVPIKDKDVMAKRVDMLGAMMTSTNGRSPDASLLDGKSDQTINYKTPEGWKEMPAGQFSVANFSVQSGDDKAVVTVSPLGGKAGSLLENVNRWRDQVKLPKIDEEQLKKDLQPDKVGGVEAQYVKINGDKEIILGFIVKRGDKTWFFKMMGPKDLVGKQETVFKEFCRSVEFK